MSSEGCDEEPRWILAAGLTFGFITQPTPDAAGGHKKEGVQCLEDGTRFRDQDWTGRIQRGNLPEAFGFRAPASGYATERTRTYGLYGASLEDLGQWAPRVAELTTGTTFRVLLDRDRARVFGYLETLRAFVPVLWVDRFGHWVAFRWQPGPEGSTVLEVKNERGQGLKVDWPAPGVGGEETVLLRADFIGMTAPSLVVWGTPGFPSAEGVPGGLLKGRPARVQLGAPGGFQGATSGRDLPGDPVSMREWQLAYAGSGGELTTLKSPNGVRTTFRYATYRYPVGPIRRGVREAVSADESTGATWTQTWMRRETDSPVQGWAVSLLSGFWDGVATEGRTVTTTYLLKDGDPERAFCQSVQTQGDSGNSQTTTFEPAPEGVRGPASFCRLHQTSTGEPTLERVRSFDPESGAVKEELWKQNGTLVQTRRFIYRAPFPDLGPILPEAVTVKRQGLPEVQEHYSYTKEGRVTRQTLQAGGQERGRSYVFDAEGRLQGIGELASWTREPGLSLTQEQGPLGPLCSTLRGEGLDVPLRETWEYGDGGQVTRHADPRGSVTSTTYDLWGRPLTVQVDGCPALTYAYPDERTRAWTQGSLSGAQQVDGFGRKRWTLRGDGVRETYGTDTYGRRVSIQESQGGITRMVQELAYDALDRPVFERIAAKPARRMTYTARGIHRVVTVTTPTGAPSIQILDPWGQRVESMGPTGTRQSTYNEFGQTTQVLLREPGGKIQARRFLFDGMGKLISRTEPETGTTTFARFNGLGQPGLATDACGRTLRRSYDALGRLRELSGRNLVLKNLYQGPLLVGRSSSDGVTQAFTYGQPGGRMTGETLSVDGIERRLQYGYDPLGRLAQVTYPSGRTVEYHYDDLNRVSEVHQNGQFLAWALYDGWGNRTALRFASGAQSLWRMDAGGRREVAWTVAHAGGEDVQSYAFDPEDHLIQAGAWTLQHDTLGQLSRASKSGLDLVYGYDGFGNNTVQTASGALGEKFNAFGLGTLADNRIPGLQANGALTGWVVEPNGEASQIGTEVAGRRYLGLGWDSLGRLEQVADSLTGAVQRYRYAPSGLRVALSDVLVPGADRQYVYSDGGLLYGEYQGNGGWLRDVIYLGEVAIAEADGAGIHELHGDPLGTPVLITCGQTGEVEGRQSFGPYGEGLDAEGYQPLTGYTGHVQADSTGLIYMRGRFYSPAWHRFLNSDQGVDPESLNQFAYGGGAPLERMDPSGLGYRSARYAGGYLDARQVKNVEMFDNSGGGGGSGEMSGADFSPGGIGSDGGHGERSGAGPGPGGSGSWGPAGGAVLQQEGMAQGGKYLVPVTIQQLKAANPFGHATIQVADSPVVGLVPVSDAEAMKAIAKEAASELIRGVPFPEGVPGRIESVMPGREIKASITLMVSRDQASGMTKFISDAMNNPQVYDPTFHNCATFVQETLRSGNVNIPVSLTPNGIVSDLKKIFDRK